MRRYVYLYVYIIQLYLVANQMDLFALSAAPRAPVASLCRARQRLALCRAVVMAPVRYDHDVLYAIAIVSHCYIPFRVQIATERRVRDRL